MRCNLEFWILLASIAQPSLSTEAHEDTTFAARPLSGDSVVKTKPRYHMWVDWPEHLNRREFQLWDSYYRDVAEYTSPGKVMPIGRMIFSVMHPSFMGERRVGKLWDVDPTAVFVKLLMLNEFNPSVEVYIHPYAEEYEEEWKRDMRTTSSLEGVFKYIDELNRLIQSIRPGSAFVTGIVCDYTDEIVKELPNIPRFRSEYTGHARESGEVVFALSAYRHAAEDIDLPGLEIVDQWFLEMSDWDQPVDILASGARYYPGKYLSALVSQGGLDPAEYANSKIQFTWMTEFIQSNYLNRDECFCPTPVIEPEQSYNVYGIYYDIEPEGSDNVYSIASGIYYHDPVLIWNDGFSCGDSNQLGALPPKVALEFFEKMRERYPAEMGSLTAHGFSRFSQTPRRWAWPY